MAELGLALIPLLTFAFATTSTPGPNNIMLVASGANFGFLKSLPHMLGIVLGIFILQIFIAFGLGNIFKHYPIIQTVLKIAGCIYLLYLAWKIVGTARHSVDKNIMKKPLSILDAGLFQFLNPKVWLMSITTMVSFTIEGELYFQSAILVASIMSAVMFISISIWTGVGTTIARFLYSDRAFKIFNWTMGGLIASCVFFILR